MDTKLSATINSSQTSKAFGFIQKLYTESGILIKDMAKMLGESEHGFRILKNTISTKSKKGLNDIDEWLMRRFSVAFVKSSPRDIKTKILYFRIIFNDDNQADPKLLMGVISDLKSKKHKDISELMSAFEYHDELFTKPPGEKIWSKRYEHKIKEPGGKFRVEYEVNVKFTEIDLFDIESGKELAEKVIKPAFDMYKECDS